MNMRTVRVSDLIPYDRNAKKHDRHQVQMLQESIAENDYLMPIVADGENVIVAGHGRHLALMAMDPDREIDIVDASHLTKTQCRKLRILDNKSVSNDYDLDILRDELSDIMSNSGTLDFTGVEMTELEDISIQSDIKNAADQDIDEFIDNKPNRDNKVTKSFKCPHCGESIEY